MDTLYSRLNLDGEIDHFWGLMPPDDGIIRWLHAGARFFAQTPAYGYEAVTPEVMRRIEDRAAAALLERAANTIEPAAAV